MILICRKTWAVIGQSGDVFLSSNDVITDPENPGELNLILLTQKKWAQSDNEITKEISMAPTVFYQQSGRTHNKKYFINSFLPAIS